MACNPTNQMSAFLPGSRNLGVVISTCSTCSKKFATQRSNDGHPAICKNCRPTKQPPAITTTSTPPVVTPILSSTPIKSKNVDPSAASGGKRGNLPPLLCKLCGVCFLYRRCLLRHLKETHSNVDVNNLHRYIDIGSKAILEKTNTSQDSQTSSLNVTVGSDITACDPDLGMDTTGSATGSIHLHISEVSGGSLQGDIGHQGLLEGAIATEAATNENAQNDKKAKSYVCSICNKTFDRPYRLQRHIQIHDPNRPRVTCQICDRSFTRYDTLENHMKCLHSDERPFKCSAEACMKAFPTQSALMHHLRTHMDGKPYKCFECDSSFALLNEHKQHMRDAHPDTQGLRCSDCYRLFPDNHSLEEHKQLEHRVECEICGKTFARLAYLQTHAEVHNGDSLFNCKYCNSGFDTEYSYKQHIKIHPEFHRSKKVYQCQLCDKTYQQPSDLVEHYRSQEHRDKANSIGLGGSILNTIEGDLSDVSVLMDEVAMGTDEDGSIIQSLTEGNEFQPTAVATSFSGTSVSGQDAGFAATTTFVGTSVSGQDAGFAAPSTFVGTSDPRQGAGFAAPSTSNT